VLAVKAKPLRGGCAGLDRCARPFGLGAKGDYVMARFTRLRVWHEAREVLRLISAVTADMRSEGDLTSQMRRAALSIVSNISEGAERGSDRDFHRFLATARASASELHAQLIIAGDLGLVADDLVADGSNRLDRLCRMLTVFMRTLVGSG
jgi:four helix bundle protein